MPNLEQEIEAQIRKFTHELADTIRAGLAEEIATVLKRGMGVRVEAPAPLPPAVKKTKNGGRTYPPHCLFDGCEQAHKGPRFSFLCPDHVGISKAAKAKLLAGWKRSEK